MPMNIVSLSLYPTLSAGQLFREKYQDSQVVESD